MIDWARTQKNIGAGVDGRPGRETWGKLFAKAVGRPFNSTFLRIGEGAAKHFPAYGVSTSIRRIAGVIAETGHESGGFTRFEENLNFTAQRMAEVWPSRFAIDPRARVKKPNARALSLHRKPSLIAAATYGMRMGNTNAQNDNDENEDGWQYRGRGLIMLTGKANYIAMGAAIGLDLLRFPDLVADPFTSLHVALEFLKMNRVFDAMDDANTILERQRVNGGLIGYDDVQEIRHDTMKLLVAA